jgi:hypothetical protein
MFLDSMRFFLIFFNILVHIYNASMAAGAQCGPDTRAQHHYVNGSLSRTNHNPYTTTDQPINIPLVHGGRIEGCRVGQFG